MAAGVAVVACGAEPNLELVRNTPLSGPHGSPVTDYLETEEKGIYAIGDLAFYPDRLMGGMRRQTHWENAREQGLVAGANMTGKKRMRYEQIPYFWTEMFDLRLDFVGDFHRAARREWQLRVRTRKEISRSLFPRRTAARDRALSLRRRTTWTSAKNELRRHSANKVSDDSLSSPRNLQRGFFHPN